MRKRIAGVLLMVLLPEVLLLPQAARGFAIFDIPRAGNEGVLEECTFS